MKKTLILLLLTNISFQITTYAPPLTRSKLNKSELPNDDLEIFRILDEYSRSNRTNFVFVYNDARILKAAANSYVEAFDFDLQFYSDWNKWFKSFKTKLAKQADKSFFHAVIKNGDIVACILFSKMDHPQEIYVDLLVVHPRSQKKGLGKKLILSIFQKHPDTKKILLETDRYDNKKTRQFYEKLGFKGKIAKNDSKIFCYTMSKRTALTFY